jgi:hypothetical protein
MFEIFCFGYNVYLIIKKSHQTLSTHTSIVLIPTTWLVSIIYFQIMNLFQIGLMLSLPVHTYLLTCETGYWSIFIYVYMTGCVKCHVYFSTFVFANESWFYMSRSSLCVVLRGLPARGWSVAFPVWRKRCISRTMMEWLTGNASATTHKTSTVDITSSPCSIWLVTWSFGVDYSHMETGPLNAEVVCHPSMAKTTDMHANSLPPFWYG